MSRLTFNLIFTVCFAAAFSQNISARSFSSDCGQVFTKKEFIIDSPGYPSNYPLNYQCSYLIKGPTCATRFSIQFLDFSIENSLGCSKDRLEIDDKDALCGNRTNDFKNYFSEKGALILRFVSDNDTSGRGYRILVTRSSCQSQNPAEEVTTQSVPKWYTTNNNVEYATSTDIPRYNKNLVNCCQSSYSSKQFVLTSPNFPYSMSSPTDCVYEIHKSNVNVCRLRIHVKFFWLGSGYNCAEGFLEIDGKRICGCKNDLKIIAPFEEKSTRKILSFVSSGNERSSYSGFVIDVTQDECPKKFVPEKENKNVSNEKMFRFYNDQINRISWPNKSDELIVEKLHLIRENTEVLAKNIREPHGKLQPQVIRHVYFYSFPDFNREPRDREETEYLDTSSNNFSVEDNTDYSSCRDWNQLQFNSLHLRHLPVCKTNEGSAVEKKCFELNQQRGYFKSPGYPFYYPGNINVCYKFSKLPGYCTIRVHIKDFNLQNSLTCENDYLIFANQLRYCGSQLMNTISTLELRNKPYEQMNFVTDAFYCGRGFFGAYEQIPCQEFPHPINPTTPLPPNPQSCTKSVQEEMFTFEVHDYHKAPCSLLIRKHSQYVCSVTLFFEKFDLLCASESLVIDGTMYCGQMTGQSVKIDIMDRDPKIVYGRWTSAGVTGLRLRIKGVQVSDECPYPEVPAERFVEPRLLSGTTMEHNEEHNKKFALKIDDRFKSRCGVITNTTESKLPTLFCDLIKRNDNNVTHCLPLTKNSTTVPLESHKIQLKIRDDEESEELKFEEINCADLMDN